MRGLVDHYARAVDADVVPSVILVALAVLDFLCIHPFGDGNGRTGRLLTLMLLYHHGFEVGRSVSLERIIEESRDGYYAALERSSAGWHENAHDPRPWLDYFLGVLLAAYAEFEQRIERIRGAEGGTKAEIVRAAVERRVEPFRVRDIGRELPAISREHLRSVLRDRREEGKLVLRGHGRGAKYVPVVPPRRASTAMDGT